LAESTTLDVHGAEEHHDVVELDRGRRCPTAGVVDLVSQVALSLPFAIQLVQLLQFGSSAMLLAFSDWVLVHRSR